VNKCKNGVLFYCLCKVLTALATFIMELTNSYGNGQFDFTKGYIYCTIINNFTQIWAMYCLVMFYHACSEELKPISPLPKFICIKAVVFFSFWQSVGIFILVFIGVIDENVAEWVGYTPDHRGVDDLGVGLQDFLICVEMLIAAIGHLVAFSHEDFKIADRPPMSRWAKLRAVFDVEDVRADMYGHMKEVGSDIVTLPVKVGKTVQKKVRRKKNLKFPVRDRLLDEQVAMTATPPMEIIQVEWAQNVLVEPDSPANASSHDRGAPESSEAKQSDD